jgi:uncharacterized protein (DUF1684 family)
MTRLLCFVFAIITTGINSSAQDAYQEEIRVWDSTRHEFLKSENGWLNLVGLLWLSEGKNSFGSDPSNAVVFPAGSVVPKAGHFDLHNGVVTMTAKPSIAITVNGIKKSSAVIHHKDSTTLPVAAFGSLRWTIKKSKDKYGIRLRDLKSPAISAFKGIERFHADPAWKVVARLEKSGSGGISITNVLGQTSEHASPGKLVFNLIGKSFSLETMTEGDQLFIIFSDETSGTTTYPSGRYLYAAKPDRDGYTTLDFNKAINPPCAFTEFATCPLPPKQNILPISITAGEKYDH